MHMLTPSDHIIYILCFQTVNYAGTKKNSFSFVVPLIIKLLFVSTH